MQARTPLLKAFPTAMQTVSLFRAQHPEVPAWMDTMKGLLRALPTLDSRSRGQANIICQQAAKVLGYIQQSASLPVQVDVMEYLWTSKLMTQKATQAFGVGATSLGAPSGPNTYAVVMSASASSAVSTLLGWDPGSPLSPAPPGNPPGLLLSIAQGVSVQPQLSAAQYGPTQQYILYRVVEGDTILSITDKFLGDPQKAAELIAFNDLRYPYISSSLAERTGTILAEWLLQGVQSSQGSGLLSGVPIPLAGALSATLVGGNPQAGDYLVFDGAQTQEAREVTTVDSTTSVLSWTAPLAYAYGDGTAVYLCKPYSTGGTVLGPGDTMMIPSNSQKSLSMVAQNGSTESNLGADIALNADGTFAPFTGTGDLPLVSGLVNLQQALRTRLNTAVGALPLHPDYGANQQELHGPDLVGQVVVESEIKSTLLQDPRVQGVKNVSVTINGTTVTYTATITLSGYQSTVAISDQIALSTTNA